jgi:hypothetical protein
MGHFFEVAASSDSRYICYDIADQLSRCAFTRQARQRRDDDTDRRRL